MISVIWFLVTVAAIYVTFTQHADAALAWFGAILAAAVASVCAVHLVKASKSHFVRELVYVSGGSYLILALVSAYLFAVL